MSKQSELISLLEMALDEHDDREGVTYNEEHWSYKANRLLYPGYHDKVKEECERLAGEDWDSRNSFGSGGSSIDRDLYVRKRKDEYTSRAKVIVGDIEKFKLDPDDGFNMRFEIIFQILHGINRSTDKEWSLELIHTVLTNAIYLNLNGTHEERVAKMEVLNIPKNMHKPVVVQTPLTPQT